MSRIKEKISALVSQQLPEFVRSDYTTFVAFVEAYYRFLEQDQNAQELIQNAQQYSDIDRTAPSFVAYFIKNYGSLIPTSVLVDKPLLLKRINDLYTAKGSALSFQLLFRILFDTNVTLKQPYEFVLRASDGVWDQPVSLRVRRTSGSVSDILNRNLSIEISGATYNAAITRVKNLSTDLYELFLKARVLPTYEIDDIVYVSDGTNTIFEGTIDPTTISYTITKGGLGFKQGQIFTVNLAGAVNTVVQIRSVSGTGAITSLKIINYGYDFPESDITVDLYNDLTVAARTTTISTKNGVSDSFQMVSYHDPASAARYFFSDYVESGYTGEILATTSSSGAANSTTVSLTAAGGDVASITFTMGALARYPGQFTSNKGFLSEPDIRLQDDQLYQPFAYQLETDVDISKFYDIVKTLIHPAGTNLFNNRVLSASANIKANVSVITRSNIFSEVYDVFEAVDQYTHVLSKGFTEVISSPSDTDIFTLNKPLTDSSAPSDNNIFVINTTYTDSSSPVDGGTVFNIGKGLVDSETPVEVLTYDLDINNVESNVTFLESLVYTIDNYAEPGYFAETYAGETTTLL